MHGCGGTLFAHDQRPPVARDGLAAPARRQGFVVPDGRWFHAARHRRDVLATPASREWPLSGDRGDAYAALLYLQAQNFVVGATRIGLWAGSNGGGAVLMAVAAHSRGRPAGFAGPDFRAAVAFYPGSCSEQRLGPRLDDRNPAC